MKWLFRCACMFLILLSSSCYRENTFDPEVIIFPGAKGFAYEVQIRGHGEGRGNPHNPFDWKVHKWDYTYWIYTNKIEGIVAASDLVLTSRWRCVEHPRSYENIKGHVKFESERMIVALDLAKYDNNDTVIGQAPLDANGTYAIRVVNESWKPITEQDARILADSCKR